MSLPEPRYQELPESAEALRPRKISGGEVPVISPVSCMIEAIAPLLEHPPADLVEVYPGWVRVSVPIIGSAGLWALIGWLIL